MKSHLSFYSAVGLFLLLLTVYTHPSEAVSEIGQSCLQDDDCGTTAVCLNNICSEPPQYFLLFTHTEDHINHIPSEKRFWYFFHEIDSLAKQYPEAHVSWTVEFMGADSETIANRNSKTGLLDSIIGYAVNDTVFQFGYHGAHEPTYTNNPIHNLASNASWDEVVAAGRQFLTLGKDPVYGGVDPSRPGGLKLLQDTFGPARIISGFGSDQAQIHTADSLSSEYVMFGFSDHGDAVNGQNYKQLVKNLMIKLCPERRTPYGIFWMNGKLRVNDGNFVEGIGLLDVIVTQPTLSANLNALDPTRVQVMNMILAPKFIYAKESPTNYAYDHPLNPELPDNLLYTDEEQQAKYDQSKANLEYLAGAYLPTRPGSRFVSGPELLGLFVDDTNKNIPLDRVTALAQTLASGYSSKPPDFVRAQGYYYTLAESWSLILQALSYYKQNRALPGSVALYVPHGPIQDAASSPASISLGSFDILNSASLISSTLLPAEWTSMPRDMIPATLTVGTKTVNAAEYLHAAAALLVQIGYRAVTPIITVQPSSLLPDIYGTLAAIGPAKYPGVGWSLKPARHR